MKYRPVQFALLGLACALLAVWQGFEAGPVVQTRQVTITFVSHLPEYVPPSRTSIRASGAVLPGRTDWNYQVGCVTPEGERCTVVTDYDPLKSYRVGDRTTADVEIHKPAGTFGWTFNSQLFAWPAALAFGLAAFQWRRRRERPAAVLPAPTFAHVAREDLIGRRLMSIRGYQQPHVEDRCEDESAWWLEFEGNAWLKLSFAIAPAFVSPQFWLRTEVVGSATFPHAEHSLPYAVNPPALAGLLGKRLLAELPDRYNEIEQLERRLGFGQDERIESVLRIGYFDPGKGIGVCVEPA